MLEWILKNLGVVIFLVIFISQILRAFLNARKASAQHEAEHDESAEARASIPAAELGWFFVLQEVVGEPRFGLDETSAVPAQTNKWDNPSRQTPGSVPIGAFGPPFLPVLGVAFVVLPGAAGPRGLRRRSGRRLGEPRPAHGFRAHRPLAGHPDDRRPGGMVHRVLRRVRIGPEPGAPAGARV